eukprot:scaffold11245_cov90-Phaeocystis_antarctica.AAC.2
MRLFSVQYAPPTHGQPQCGRGADCHAPWLAPIRSCRRRSLQLVQLLLFNAYKAVEMQPATPHAHHTPQSTSVPHTARRTLVASSALGRNAHSLARNRLDGFLEPFLCRARRILGRAERRGLAIRLVVALRVRLPRVAGRQLGLELVERVVPDGGVAHRVDGVVVGARG